MKVKLFDIQNDKVIETEHCHTLKTLKDIKGEYPDDYLKVYQYLFYMTCPDPDDNPFFNLKLQDKESLIIDEVELEVSLDCEFIEKGLKFCEKLYETPTSRAYNGLKIALDRMADYMAKAQITDGKDGNINQISRVAKDFDSIRQSFKGVYKDLKDEQEINVRGNKNLAYDG